MKRFVIAILVMSLTTVSLFAKSAKFGFEFSNKWTEKEIKSQITYTKAELTVVDWRSTIDEIVKSDDAVIDADVVYIFYFDKVGENMSKVES